MDNIDRQTIPLRCSASPHPQVCHEGPIDEVLVRFSILRYCSLDSGTTTPSSYSFSFPSQAAQVPRGRLEGIPTKGCLTP